MSLKSVKHVKNKSLDEILGGKQNTMETTIAKVLMTIKLLFKKMHKDPNSEIHATPPEEILVTLVSNLIVNLVSESIDKEISADEKIKAMMEFCGEVFKMSVAGYGQVLERQGMN